MSDFRAKLAAGFCVFVLAVLFAAFLPDLPYWAKIAASALFGFAGVTCYRWLYGRWRPVPTSENGER
ncbi:MAG: hypothetical protein AAGA21_04185 [Pseudomonadota bacterium]